MSSDDLSNPVKIMFGRHAATVRTDFSPRNEMTIIRFPNGYGASVVRYRHLDRGVEEPRWELAVIRHWSSRKDAYWYTDYASWELCYSTPITDDVIGGIDGDDVAALLDRIEALPDVEEQRR